MDELLYNLPQTLCLISCLPRKGTNLRRTRKGRAAAKPIFDEAARQPETAKAPKTGKEKYPDKKSKEDEQKAAPELRKRGAPQSIIGSTMVTPQ